MSKLFRATLSAALALIIFVANSAGQTPPPLLEVLTTAGTEAGLPIHWGSEFGMLLKPNGMMLEIEMSNVRTHRVLETPFVPQTITAARSSLQSEMGNGFETTTVGPYVICAPRGRADRWRDRFRVLLGGYSRYFQTRGWQLRSPDFPLCVTILPSKSDFDRYCLQQLGRVMPNLMGYYFPKSNRCVLFEVGGGTPSTDWSETERTIIHEAVHQLAYNTGVHERLADNPQWVVEGLATMFEEPGVFDSKSGSGSIEGRFHANQLAKLRTLMLNQPLFESQMTNLIQTNDMFKRDPSAAYAISWGMTFYLAERMANQFGAYTQKMAHLGKLHSYEAENRLLDFQRGFDSDPNLLAIQMLRFFRSGMTE